ncbi:MAG TPA: ADP-ribosylation factor-like protein [Candidatus Deferrimicrobium sp.]|nr:ADP-ribosylation factor-like protein [Candidatus Deferrimicrobium sp.]
MSMKKFQEKIYSLLIPDLIRPEKIKDLKNMDIDVIRGIGEAAELIKSELKTTKIKDLAKLKPEKARSFAEEHDINVMLLEEWMTIAKLIMRAEKYRGEIAKKVMLLGIDNAGKTAISKTLTIKYRGNLQAFGQMLKDLLPTKGAVQDRLKVSNVNVMLWDLGGQQQYRKIYLEEPERFFFDTSAVIYVVDIQDEERFDETMDYLERIVKIFHFLKENPYFMVLFHKYDPELEMEPKYQVFIKDLTKRVSKTLSDANITFQLRNSSVYNDLTVFNAFTELIRIFANVDVQQTINQILEKHARITGLDNLVLFDLSGVRVGEYCQSKEITELINSLTIQNLQMLVMEDEQVLLEFDGNYFSAIPIFLEGKTIILSSIHGDPSVKEKLSQDTPTELEPWLESLME